MVERRWLLRMVPPVGAALGCGLLAASAIGAADGAWQPPPCGGGTARLMTAVRAPGPATPAEVGRGPWFTLDPQLDAVGSLAGHRLHVGLGHDRARYIKLPPEAAAAGPFGRLVLVIADDGNRSEVRSLDAAGACEWTIGGSSDVIRRATIDPGGTSLYEFRVDRATRADLGVWRRGLDGSAARQVLTAAPADPDRGPTYSTTLTWTAEGDRLAVQQCGARHCGIRLYEPATGAVTHVDDPDQGELVGVAEGSIVRYESCPGLPCAVVARRLDDGRLTVLNPTAGLARLIDTPDGPRVALQAGRSDDSVEIRRFDGALDGLIPLPAGSAYLMPGPDRAQAGVRLPPGWLAASADGRSPSSAVLTRLSDGATVELREVTP
ncbi:MAG TPA: hypothetical protein VM344_02820 [Vitreimonas sp.]|nr:hypothetical protein [Vitreimonas sp.]